MRNYMQLVESMMGGILGGNEENIRAVAWQSFLNNLDENENELEDFISDYEDETGESVTPAGGQENVRGGELTDPDFAEWLKAKVSEEAEGIIAKISAASDGSTITAYRAVWAPGTWDPNKSHPGVHWSVTPEQAIAHFGAKEKKDWKLFILKAKIPFTSIDWDQTTKAQLSQEFGEEDEITVLENRPVQIIDVEIKDHE